MRPSAAAGREAPATFLVPAAFEAATGLGAGDEGGQTIDIAGFGLGCGLLAVFAIGLLSRLIAETCVTVTRTVLTRLLAVPLGVRLLALFARLLIALLILRLGLRLAYEAGFSTEIAEVLAVVLFASWLRRLLMLRQVLPELLLGRRDQAEIVLGMLVVVLGGDWIARTLRIAGELQIFLGDMGGGAANLDVGAVGFIDPGHRVLAAAIRVVTVVPVTHPLFILTVSHEVPFRQP